MTRMMRGAVSRRTLVASMAASLVAGGLPLAVGRSAARARPVFVHGFGTGSTTGVMTQFAASVVLFKTGARPWITTVPGEHGYAAFEHFQSQPGDEPVYLVADTMTLMLNAVRRKSVDRILAIDPVVKLTNGISLGLVASASSGIHRFEDIRGEGQKQALRLAHAGRWSAAGIALAWMLPDLPSIREVVCSGNDTVLKAVAQGEADLGIVVTNALPRAQQETPGLKVLTSFGAGRSPHYPEVRTYAELVGDPKKAFTSSFSLFGRPDTDRAELAALAEAFARPFPSKIVKSLDWLAQNVVVSDEATVRETVRRDLRVAMSAVRELAPT